MKIICLHWWVVVVNGSEATQAHRTCGSTHMALQTTRIQLEIPTENRQTGLKLPDSPTGSTRPCQDKINRLWSFPSTQMAHVYVHSVSKESRRSEKVSVPNSPTRSARSCLSQSNGLESHANTVSVHIHMRRTMRKLESICEHVSNAELAYQECSIGVLCMGEAKKAQEPNGHVGHTRRTS